MSGLVAIVDYGMCNLDSVARAVEECGGTPLVTDRPADLKTVSQIILPGVGSFADAMRNLRQRGLDTALVEQVRGERIPLLGICLGMQLLATRGFEGGETPGLDLIAGEVVRLQPTPTDPRLPHVGWNEVHPVGTVPFFAGFTPGRDCYFVHSYHFVPADPGTVIARTPYAGGFVSAVARDAIVGVQFHPEKSQKAGFLLLRNFLQS